MPRTRSNPTPAVFYGYPVELIQRWCSVSRQTAYLYKIGARQPSRQALRLFVLHRDGRVLGDEWQGWSVQGGKLFDPEGQGSDHRQLRAYWIIVQLANELASRDPVSKERYLRILRSA